MAKALKVKKKVGSGQVECLLPDNHSISTEANLHGSKV